MISCVLCELHGDQHQSGNGKHEEMKASLRQAFALDESLKMKALDDPAFENVFGEEKSL